MATTEIHAIRRTPKAALAYVMADKLIPYVEGMHIWDDCPSEIVEIPNEVGVLQQYIRYPTLSSQYQCNPKNPMITFDRLQQTFQNKKRRSTSRAKGGEPLLWHAHQSFKGREVDPITANIIGLKLAEEVFKGFAVNISTHTDGANIHNHFIVSAWGYDGRKWNNNLAMVQKIREVSDRLCEEYGLSVLDKTRKMKLVRYNDAAGTIRYFEPTDRKAKLISDRELGNTSPYDVGNFRNTRSYEAIKRKEKESADMIQRDIDSLLPYCSSYEELLSRLSDLGYSIRAKKKNGDWLSHISFKPPTASKPTREDKIGDGSFYLRENLTAYLAERAVPEVVPEAPSRYYTLPLFTAYEYGVTDLAQIDDDWRKTRNEFGEEIVVPRTEQERMVITDIRQTDTAVRGLLDTTTLKAIINEQTKPHISSSACSKQEELVQRIKDGFRCLQYLESHNIQSNDQLKALYKAQKQIRDDLSSQLTAINSKIRHLQKVQSLPEIIKSLEEKIAASMENEIYIIDQFQEDVQKLETYKSIVRKYKIDDSEALSLFREKLEESMLKAARIEDVEKKAISHIAELDHCLMHLNRLSKVPAKQTIYRTTAERDLTRNSRPKRTYNRER